MTISVFLADDYDGPLAGAEAEERLEYTLVGDTVNLAQRLQQWADGGEIIVSDATFDALDHTQDCEALAPALVKGRQSPVRAYRVGARGRK